MLVFRSPFLTVINLAAACFMAVFLTEIQADGARLQQFAVVRVDKLNVRTGPDSDTSVFRVLEKDERVRVLMEHDGWLQVVVGDEIGYISSHSRYVERIAAHRVSGRSDEQLELAMARAREIQRRISEKQKELRDVCRQENVVIEDLEILDRESAEHREQLRLLMAAAEEVGARICMLQAKADDIRADLKRREIDAGNRIATLYRLCRLGSMNLFATADSAHQLLLRKAGVEKVVEHDESVLRQIQEQQKRLNQVLSRLRDEQKHQQSLALEYEEMLTSLAGKRNQRQQMLAALENRKSDSQETLDSLDDAARLLKDTISALKSEEPEGSANFASYQGLLKMPVQGKIVSGFGKLVTPDSGVVNYCNGLEVRSPIGSPVRAVFDGNVAYADWLKGYGRVVILSHGGNYHTVYAHIGDLFCSRDQAVESGEVIATVGDSGSGGGPALYFEIRHHGNPVDPLKWIDPSIQSDNG